MERERVAQEKKCTYLFGIRLYVQKAKCKFSFIISRIPEPTKQMLSSSSSRFSISAVKLDRSATAKKWHYKSGNKSSQQQHQQKTDEQGQHLFKQPQHIFTADRD